MRQRILVNGLYSYGLFIYSRLLVLLRETRKWDILIP